MGKKKGKMEGLFFVLSGKRKDMVRKPLEQHKKTINQCFVSPEKIGD